MNLMPTSRTARNYCFTINNPGDFCPKTWITNNNTMTQLKFLCFQMERGERDGTVHIQGYLEVKNPIRLAALKRLFHPTAHFEIRQGTREQAILYCMKEDTRIPNTVPVIWSSKDGYCEDWRSFEQCMLAKSDRQSKTGKRLSLIRSKICSSSSPSEMAKVIRLYRRVLHKLIRLNRT